SLTGVDALDVERLGRGHAQTPSLPHGEPVNAAVPREYPPPLVHHAARGLRSGHSLDEAGVVAVGDEADLHALRLRAGRQPVTLGDGADLGLAEPADGELELRERFLPEGEEEVALVLGWIGGPQQAEPSLGPLDTGVVAGGETGPERAGPREEKIELHVPVAGDAGNGRLPVQVRLHE